MKIITIIHIAAGVVALVSGLAAMGMKKGSVNHKLSGKIFVISMLLVSLGGMILHLPRGLFFLPAVGVFTFYLAYTGFRIFKIQKKGYNFTDQFVSYLCLIAGLGLLYLALSAFIKGENNMWTVTAAFSITCIAFSLKDLRRFRKKTTMVRPKEFHLQRMGGAFIGAVTALLVVNAGKFTWVQMHPGSWPLVWFLPTIVGSLLIARTIIKLRKHEQ